jgi:hypothetical protein
MRGGIMSKLVRTLGICLLILSCGQNPAAKLEPIPKSKTEPQSTSEFTLQSPAFQNNERIPDKFTGKGENVSPALIWNNPPTGTQSFALIIDDPDAPRGTFTHWIIYDIPFDASALSEGVPRSEILPDSSRQIANSANRIGYDGPLPPPGKVHHYRFKLYALDRKLGKIAQPIEKEMESHILVQTMLTSTYQR